MLCAKPTLCVELLQHWVSSWLSTASQLCCCLKRDLSALKYCTVINHLTSMYVCMTLCKDAPYNAFSVVIPQKCMPNASLFQNLMTDLVAYWNCHSVKYLFLSMLELRTWLGREKNKRPFPLSFTEKFMSFLFWGILIKTIIFLACFEISAKSQRTFQKIWTSTKMKISFNKIAIFKLFNLLR